MLAARTCSPQSSHSMEYRNVPTLHPTTTGVPAVLAGQCANARYPPCVTTSFEFRISVVGPDWLTGKNGDDAARELNELGEQGWQLATVFSHPDDSLVSVILQRVVNRASLG